MEVTQANLDLIFRQAELKFGAVLAATSVWNGEIATTMPCSTRQVDYGWMARVPSMRKWLGDRQLNSVATHVRTVVNEPFEDTLVLEARDVRDDQFGIFNMAVQYLAAEAAKQVDYRIAQAIRDASVTVGYDGVPVFSTLHPINGGNAGGVSGTQSNLFVSKALTYDNYVNVRAAMMAYKGEDGKPLTVIPDLLVVPPQREGDAKLILESDFLSGVQANTTAPQSNTYKGSARILVIPELADYPNNWWLFDTKKIVKPWLWQMRQAPRFTYLTNPTDMNVFMSNQFLYGVDMEGAAAETLYFLMAAGTSEAAYIPA